MGIEDEHQGRSVDARDPLPVSCCCLEAMLSGRQECARHTPILLAAFLHLVRCSLKTITPRCLLTKTRPPPPSSETFKTTSDQPRKSPLLPLSGSNNDNSARRSNLSTSNVEQPFGRETGLRTSDVATSAQPLHLVLRQCQVPASRAVRGNASFYPPQPLPHPQSNPSGIQVTTCQTP